MGLFTKYDRSVFNEDKAGILGNLGGGAVRTLIGLGMGWADIYKLAEEVSKGKSLKEALEEKMPSQKVAEAVESKLNLPVTGASEEKYAPVFAAGGGAVPIAGWSKGLFGALRSSAMGAGVAGSAQALAPNSPEAQMALGFGLPYAAGVTKRGIQTKIANDYSPRVTEKEMGMFDKGNMTLGELTGNEKLLRMENKLRTDSDVATKAQKFDANRADDIRTRIDSIIGNRSMDDATAARKAQAAVDSFVQSKSSAMYEQAKKEFNAAKAENTQFDMTPVVQKIDELLAQYGERENTSQTRTIVKELQSMREAYVGQDGQVAAIDPNRMLNRLRDWSKASSSGEGIFSDVDRTVTKHIASEVYKSFLSSLDSADGELIKTARDNYKKNMAEINDVRAQPIIKFFDVENVNELSPEQIVAKLKKTNPSQRQYITSILDKYDPEIMKNVGQSALEDALNKGNLNGAAEGQPTWSMQQFLKSMDKSQQDFVMSTITDPMARADFQRTLNQMRLAIREPLSVPDSSGVGKTVSQGVMAVSQSGPAAAGVRAMEGVGDFLRNQLVSKDQMFDLLFNPELRGKDLKSRIVDFTKQSANVAAPRPFELRALATSMPNADDQQVKEDTRPAATDAAASVQEAPPMEFNFVGGEDQETKPEAAPAKLDFNFVE